LGPKFGKVLAFWCLGGIFWAIFGLEYTSTEKLVVSLIAYDIEGLVLQPGL
jgi:hypothetical protein